MKRLQRTLDDVLAARVPVQEYLKGEHLLDRTEVLRVIPTRSDPHMMILNPPGWREAFSWKVLIAKSMNQLEDGFRGLKDPPIDDQFPEMNSNSSYASLALRSGGRTGPVLTRSRLCRDDRDIIASDRYWLTQWHAVRLATAILRFEKEKGWELKDLSELVPDYLPAIPKAPYGNQPYLYGDGKLRAKGFWSPWRLQATK